MTVDYRVGDTRDVIATIPDGSVSLVACSPPFLALRSYLPADHPDKHAEIGSEPDPATFLDTLLALTADWGRVLAPWGSIAIELGDTFAGSGGAGGDYNADGLREGQGKFAGSNRAGMNGRHSMTEKAKGGHHSGGNGWPRPKCLALIPQAYAMSLAYGRNIITGAESPAGQWLVRNMIVWHRPNPAVGALGDKFRPCTSYITVATRSPKRWFDLTAVRNTESNTDRKVTGWAMVGGEPVHGTERSLNAAGAPPPLDAWFDEHDTWTVTTQPSSIKATIESREPCGPHDGGERTTSPDCPVHGDQPGHLATARCDVREGVSSARTRRIETHPEQSQQLADSCDESTSSRSGQSTASGHSTSLSRTAHDQLTSVPGTPSAGTAAGTEHTSTSPELCGDHPDTSESSSDEACPPVGVLETAANNGHTQGQESACTCTFHRVTTSVHGHYAMWPAKLAERLILSMCPAEVCTSCGEPRRRIEDKVRHMPTRGDGSHEGSMVARMAGRSLATPLSGLPSGTTTTTTTGWTDCGCGDGCYDELVGTWTPGVVLDPFAGTGTTLAVADIHGRDAIGIDIDPRNPLLYDQRRAECARNLFGSPIPDPAQLDLFGAA